MTLGIIWHVFCRIIWHATARALSCEVPVTVDLPTAGASAILVIDMPAHFIMRGPTRQQLSATQSIRLRSSPMATRDLVSERSAAPIEDQHLERLAGMALLDQDDFFRRIPRYRVLRDRLLLVGLCQGGALHYLDRKTGVKDLDIYTFYGRHPDLDYPDRRRKQRDFGPSSLGRHPDDVGLSGRRVDLMGRSIDLNAGPIDSVQTYLRRGRSTTAKFLAEKAVIAIHPPELFGKTIWPLQ